MNHNFIDTLLNDDISHLDHITLTDKDIIVKPLTINKFKKISKLIIQDFNENSIMHILNNMVISKDNICNSLSNLEALNLMAQICSRNIIENTKYNFMCSECNTPLSFELNPDDLIDLDKIDLGEYEIQLEVGNTILDIVIGPTLAKDNENSLFNIVKINVNGKNVEGDLNLILDNINEKIIDNNIYKELYKDLHTSYYKEKNIRCFNCHHVNGIHITHEFVKKFITDFCALNLKSVMYDELFFSENSNNTIQSIQDMSMIDFSIYLSKLAEHLAEKE